MFEVKRDTRTYFEDQGRDPRRPARHDRDRILHSNALRRLAGVTQVVKANEGQVYHNRLTHTLKVAQIARSIAEKLNGDSERNENIKLSMNLVGQIDPDVVEAAALAHDLGHPPFGHTGEKTLNELVLKYNKDGFEGNAQSFRIVTKLATRRRGKMGLNLTYATLVALQKYPWVKNERHAPALKNKKWGAYHSEKDLLDKLRKLVDQDYYGETLSPRPFQMSPEAAIMDISDDIAYATHDIEDFYRAGLIPLQYLWSNDANHHTREADLFIDYVAEKRTFWKDKDFNREYISNVFHKLMGFFRGTIDSSYKGHHEQKAILRTVSSFVIDSYIKSITLNSSKILQKNTPDNIPELLIFTDITENNDELTNYSIREYTQSSEIKIFKDLTRYYVHENQTLKTQQYGEERIIKELFEIIFAAYKEAYKLLNTDEEIDEDQIKTAIGILPSDHAYIIDFFQKVELDSLEVVIADGSTLGDAFCARLTADYICGMSEDEAISLFNRLTGHNLGSVRDLLF